MNVQEWIKEKSKQYTFDKNGRIANPGRFQGETLATVYYWNAWLDGDGESRTLDGYEATVFDVTPEEAEAFDLPEWIAIWTSENGFVYLTELTGQICFD
jgi:hypothetical protein